MRFQVSLNQVSQNPVSQKQVSQKQVSQNQVAKEARLGAPSSVIVQAFGGCECTLQTSGCHRHICVLEFPQASSLRVPGFYETNFD